jgi:tripartite-type tricarboxylate transporter receptor subunit TctC
MRRRAFLASALSAPMVSSAFAQSWPERPVTIVVPFAAGGGTDTIARVLADRLSDAFGQRFIVENRTGGGGMIGAGAVAKSASDGYTLLVASPAEIAINPHVFPRMPYDPQKDLAPISLLAITPLIIAAHPSLNISSPQQLIEVLKASPGKLSYSTPGVGSGHHLVGEFLKKIAGVEMVHIAYRGAGPAVQDAVGGQVPLTISGMPPVVGQIKGGTLKAVAVTSSKRSPLFPDVMALAELGPDYALLDVTNWFGLFAPASLPQDITVRLHAATLKALQDTTVRQRIAEQGAEAVGNSPQDFSAFIQAESEKYARMASITNVKVQ